MATPYAGAVSGTSDAYNFYHSQLRIRVECAFGMLTERWAILRSCIPNKFTVTKSIALVCALAKLHNFCIDESDAVPVLLAQDCLQLEGRGLVPMIPLDEMHQSVPEQLIGGGAHFDDYPRNLRRAIARQYENGILPREKLREHVDTLGYTRPQP